MADVISQEVNVEMRERLPDGTFKVKYPKTKREQIIGLENVQNYGVATKTEAEAGTSNSRYMTPLRVKEAFNSNIVIGTYTGDGAAIRTINVGFTPRAVIVAGHSGFEGRGSQGFATAELGTMESGANSLTITTNGFNIYLGSGAYYPETNRLNTLYNYMAIR